MGKLILIRHGQTEMNAQSLYFGKLNPPLNDLGISQAYQAREKLLNIDYDNIYSSPLERAKQTAEICNYLDKDIVYDSNLEEINFGIFEGLTFKEISEKYPVEVKKMKEDWKEYNYVTGESPKEMLQRAVSFLEILDYTKNNLIVAHWGIINSIISYFISGNLDSYWKFKIQNASIVIFEGNFEFSYLTKLD
ncbi:histidine phosphatase family protein [Fusobacterium nucleatum subsp. nucleatum ATCC 23726]|uniref:Alpha-ribazole-5'-phosphate phosphatase n=3 Tax=Fusobacterium nucleatum subsp. nucleatum TaxID=76856 RepID=Q8R667_FUSNN|nr:histidine phosphatase family protein [Fusobacterium nucleatum]AAL95107.1 Alpha-ribazole-5'-phosphate phosphatase [Fusobacterium nucleatum subsp. nucleatum ATCC 25586]ALF24313.1 alpha-ribazole phosphatase [Fusobacterium nucleatum subsp. nucleatum ChDC F316]ALF25374.1 alpha-ribazole phosphatase [Fusobacterium nucleatum subsp. nucleatum]ASG26412.1 histidine phosphatase family protein [Fusobacterium nucleatum subsp. nucleatum]AVQ15277.1 histidine phosphatase family protein [Fusobacterium nuclea